MHQWKKLFQKHILERGLGYYEMGLVYDIERTEGRISATVEGTEDYTVEIEFNDEEILQMYCDCPYADSGKYCKHMAAVLFAVEENEEATAWQDPFKNVKEAQEQLKKAIESIPVEDLRQKLFEAAWKDSSLRNYLLTKYMPITLNHLVKLKREVDEIAYHYSDRGGFINYHYAYDYTCALSDFLDSNIPVFIEKGNLMEAFDLVNYVFCEAGNRELDDSDGGICLVADRCYTYWKNILAACDDKGKKTLFDWFMRHRENYVVDYMEDYINDFLRDEFEDEELLREKMRVLDDMISQKENDSESGYFYSVHYGKMQNILERISIMKKLNYSKAEIAEYRKQYRNFHEIRGLEIAEYIDERDYESAIRVLQESKVLDKQWHGLLSNYSEKLMMIYEEIGNSQEYKKELLFCIFEIKMCNADHLLKLKTFCTDEEWEKYREEFLVSDSNYQVRFELMEREGLFQRLLDEVAKMNHIYVLDNYEKELKKNFPQEVRNLYVQFVQEEMSRASSRKFYREYVGYLRKIAAYPDGKRVAKEIADEWKMKYKRRSAMMDELRKVGF